MNDAVLACWKFTAPRAMATPVIPDGCRDLIFFSPFREKPSWFISPLSDQTYRVAVKKGDDFIGYRLKPGTSIDEAGLLAAVGEKSLPPDEIYSLLERYTTRAERLHEALACLASDVADIASAAAQLGVTSRALQRLVLRETGRSPVYWLQLARVRRAGRAVFGTKPLAEIAFEHGYADQAHMSRAFRRWLGSSPAALQKDIQQARALLEPGYD